MSQSPDHRRAFEERRHESRQRRRRNPEARRDRVSDRLSGQPDHRGRRRGRYPHDHGAPGADRAAYVRRDRQGHLGRPDRRLCHAARPRHRKRLWRGRAILWQLDPGRRVAGRLCPQHQPGASELQRRAQLPQRHQIVRAGDGRQRDSRGAAPRLYDGQERPPRPGPGRVPERPPARGGAGRAGRRIPEDAKAQERPRPAIGLGDCRGAGRGAAPGHRRRPGRPLRQGVAAAEGARRTARSPGHDDARRQKQLPGKPSVVPRLGRHRHRRRISGTCCRTPI